MMVKPWSAEALGKSWLRLFTKPDHLCLLRHNRFNSSFGVYGQGSCVTLGNQLPGSQETQVLILPQALTC